MHKAQHVADAARRPDIALGARGPVLRRSTATVEPGPNPNSSTMPLTSACDSIPPCCPQFTPKRSLVRPQYSVRQVELPYFLAGPVLVLTCDSGSRGGIMPKRRQLGEELHIGKVNDDELTIALRGVLPRGA